MKCPNCGADISAASLRCEYCGSAIGHSPAAVASSSDATVFSRIKQSPHYGLRMAADRLERLPKPGFIALAIPLVFIVIFISASGFMAISAISHGAGGFAIVPAGFVILGALMFIGIITQTARFRSSPSLGRPAIIRTKRTHVSEGGNDSSASTDYHVTAEFEDGQRQEFKCEASFYGRVAEQDAGILYTKGEFALDFDRVT